MSVNGNFLTVAEAAKKLNVVTSRITVLCRQGRFEGATKASRIWLIPKSSVKNFVRLPVGAQKKVSNVQFKQNFLSKLNLNS